MFLGRASVEARPNVEAEQQNSNYESGVALMEGER